MANHELAIKLPRHSKAIAAKEMLPREFYDSLFKFAFVRNPWDLQVSSYHHSTANLIPIASGSITSIRR